MSFIFKTILAMGLAIGHSFAWAQDAPIVKSLYELGTVKEPLALTGDKAAYTFKIPISPREAVEGGTLRLNTVNSTALIKSRSALTVRLNGLVLGQFPLDPMSPKQSNLIALPAGQLKPGFNDLSVQVVQHYTNVCERPESPELWTEIDPVGSQIELNVLGLRPNAAPRLSQLQVALDSRIWQDVPIKVVTATESFGPAQLGALSYVTQGVTLRKGKHLGTLEILGAQSTAAYTTQDNRFPGLNPELTRDSDLVLVGTQSELNRLIDSETTSKIEGPYLGIYPTANSKYVVIVVSGRNEEELFAAARAFAQPDFRFTDSASAIITGETPRFAPETTGFGSPVTFNKFGYRTQSTRGWRATPLTVEFRTPGTFTGQSGEMVKVKLHFSYGAGLRGDSSLNVKVNGQFATAVGLNDPRGAEYSNYDVAIPSTLVKPGFNTLTFEPVFIGHKENCDPLRDENMVLTIFDSSTMSVPQTSKPVTVPDLARFSNSLWPHAEQGNITLLGSDSKSVTAAMQLVGAMALKNKGPFDADFSYDIPSLGHSLVIGSFGSITQPLQEVLPLPSRFSWQSGGTASAWMQGQKDQRVITAFISPSPDNAISALNYFIQKGFWNALAGEAAIIDTELATLDVIPARNTQAFTKAMGLGAELKDWKLVSIASALLAIAFAISLVRLLRRKAMARVEQRD